MGLVPAFSVTYGGSAGEDLTMKGKRLVWPSVLLLASALQVVLVAGVPASAYASGTGFQVVESLSCTNPSFCGSLGLASFHGTAQFNSDGTASGQLTVGGLVQASGPAAVPSTSRSISPTWAGSPGGSPARTGTFSSPMRRIRSPGGAVARRSRCPTPSRPTPTTWVSRPLRATSTPRSYSGSPRRPG